MDEFQPVKPDRLIEPRHRRIERINGPEFVAGSECVACVEANPDQIVALRPVDDPPDLFEAPAHAVLCASGVLKQKHHRTAPLRACLFERTDCCIYSRYYAHHAALRSCPEMASEMRHKIGDVEHAAPRNLACKRINRAAVDILLRRCQIRQIRRMSDRRVDA